MVASPAASSLATLDILMIGPSGAGKTSFARRLQTGEFGGNHEPTENCVAYTLPSWKTQRPSGEDGPQIEFTLYEVNSLPQDRLAEICKKVVGVIVMFDLQDGGSLLAAQQIYRDLASDLCQDLPVALCGNKCDMPWRSIPSVEIATELHSVWKPQINAKTQYYDISALSCYQFDKPFMHIAVEALEELGLKFQ